MASISGTTGDDSLAGTTSADQIYGDLGHDTIWGDDGDDTIYGEDGSDTIYGGDGNDTILGGDGDLLDTSGNSLYGGDGNDTILGGDYNDYIEGGTGNDFIVGYYGNDTVYGESGNDTIWDGYGADTIYGGDGDDSLSTEEIAPDPSEYLLKDVIYGGAGNDYIATAWGDDYVEGGSGNDDIATWLGDDTVYGGDGSDHIHAYLSATDDGNDTYFGQGGDDTIEGVGGDDLISGGSGADLIYGGDGADTISGDQETDIVYGGDGADTIYGGDENDIIYGGDGLDHLYGGTSTAGSGPVDIFVFESDSAFNNVDIIYDYVSSTTTSGNGDVIDISDLLAAYDPDTDDINDFVELSEVSGDTYLTVDVNGSGSSYVDIVKLDGVTGEASVDELVAAGKLVVESYDNLYLGKQVSDGTINGTSNNDLIYGGGASSGGPETIYGGDGDDVVRSYFTHMLDGGNGNDILYGSNGQINLLYGQDGNDVLYGFGAQDTFYGGSGDDTFYGGSEDDVADYSSSSASVIVDLDAGTATGEGSDTLDSIEGVVGSSYADTIVGDSADNTIDGGAGDDTLTDGDGDDILSGGSGSDIHIIGKEASASDTITDFSLTDDVIDLSAFDTDFDDFGDLSLISAGGGADTIIDLGNGQELRLEDVTVASLDHTHFLGNVGYPDGAILGTSGNDTLSGTSGADIIYGLEGDDTLSGLAGDDTLYGGDDDDTLYGGDDDDIMDGGDGDNLLDGGDGDDHYATAFNTSDGNNTSIIVDYGWFENELKLTNVASSQSSDVTLSYEGADLHIVYTPSGGDTETLIVQNYWTYDIVTTSSGSMTVSVYDILYSDDVSLINPFSVTSAGTNSADTYTPGGSSDILYRARGGDDVVTTGSGDDIVWGEAANDTIDSGAGDDVIFGGAGLDELTGGAGDDLLYGGTGGDDYHFESGDGNDVIYELYKSGDANDWVRFETDATIDENSLSFLDNGTDLVITYGTTDTITVENHFVSSDNSIESFKFSNANAYYFNFGNVIVADTDSGDSITGISGADHIFGGLGDDTLDGYHGNDTIFGGEGEDIIYGGYGGDRIFAGADSDTIYGEYNNDTLSGGEGDDLLYGGSGLDTLFGGDGADSFIFESGKISEIDIISDYVTGDDDVINLADVLSYDSMTDTLTDFVLFADSGSDTTVSIDADGTGGFTQIATILGVTGLTDEAALVSSGNLIVE